MLPYQFRLTSPRDIGTILKRGMVVKGGYFSLYWRKNNLPHSRFGFIFSRKEIKKATERNLLKRRVSEITKELVGGSQGGYDVLFIFSHNTTKLSFQELREYVHTILQKIKIVK